jgi:signal transduction histidine kinase
MRIWPILLLGFSSLVLLIAFSGFSALERARSIYAGVSELHDTEQHAERLLAQVRSDILSSAIVVRDEIYQTYPSASFDRQRAELRSLQTATAADLVELGPLIPKNDAAKLEAMRQDLNDYWHSLDALFLWTPAQKARLNRAFLHDEIFPRRQAVLMLLGQVEELNRDSTRTRRQDVDRREAGLPVFVSRLIGATILVGILVAIASAVRISALEAHASKQQAAVVAAGEELRNLSRQLVETQEEERRSLSRELHDQIGQLLTAIRIGAGNLEEDLPADSDRAKLQLDQIKRLSEQTLRTVRDLAMGLRPAMLDDLGLGAALEWQARQHSRLCGVPVSLELDGAENLSDSQRTCVYRVVQEALTNIAKHARALNIAVSVKTVEDGISILVRDDGAGFDVAEAGKGLGLLGIKERVRQLGGDASIESQRGSGTSLRAWLPLEMKGDMKRVAS